MMRYFDFHTHHCPDDPAVTALVSFDAAAARREGFGLRSGCYWSLELHPWQPDLTVAADFQQLAATADAVGEAGLDRLRGGDWAHQMTRFGAVAEVAHRLRKPLVLHVVRAGAELLAWRRKFPADPWLWHGWRGPETLLRQLLAADIFISCHRPMPAWFWRLMAEHPQLLALESDGRTAELAALYTHAAAALGWPPERLAAQLADNFNRFLFHHQQKENIGCCPIAKG